MDRIKRLSYEVLEKHKSKFGEDFADNKKTLDQISIIRSKGLKNEVAGYITKFIKKEIREEKTKQAQIAASQAEELQRQEESNSNVAEESEDVEESAEIPSSIDIQENTDVESTPQESEITEEKTE